MNPSMFLFAALALCAFPSAMGIWCYDCTPNDAQLCNMTSQYTKPTCQDSNSVCYKTSMMVNSSLGMVMSYALGCLAPPNNCTSWNSSFCSAAEMEATQRNATLLMCDTMCSNTSGSNSPFMISPTSTMMMPVATASVTVPPTTMGAAELSPTFLGVLFIILFTILHQ